MKKLRSIISNRIALILGVLLLIVWETAAYLGWLPQFIIPAPSEIIAALISQWRILGYNSLITLYQALVGLFFGILLAFIFSIAMDRVPLIRRALYPYLVVSQTIPTVAIAPILVLWLGYGMLPKVVLVILTTLFPIVINILEGFASVDKDSINLLELMGANHWQILWHVKLPSSLSYFFSGLKISVSYAFVGSVVAEWLGGFEGLGVYMIRAKNSFAYDNMFAAIVVISGVSLLLLGVVSIIERLMTPWQYNDYKKIKG
jgi:ABC-type nitrate/sulfonate/bicarbonate transport system permease component